MILIFVFFDTLGYDSRKFSLGSFARGGQRWVLAQMDPSHFEAESELRRYEALLQMADLVVRPSSLSDLFSDFTERLRQYICFHLINFVMHEPAENVMQLYFWRGKDVKFEPRRLALDQSPSGWVWQHQVPLAIENLTTETRFGEGISILRAAGMQAYYVFPVTAGERRLGGMGLACAHPNVYAENDIRFLQRVAELMALALENALTRGALQQEKERLQMLLQVNSTLVANLDVQKHFPAISDYIRKVIRHDFASVALYDESSQSLRKYAFHHGPGYEIFKVGDSYSLRDSTSGQAFLAKHAKVFHSKELQAFSSDVTRKLLAHGVKSICCIPLATRKGTIGVMSLASKEDDAFVSQDVGLLKQIGSQIAIALDNAHAYREIRTLKDKLAEEKLYLQGEINSGTNFEEIVGESPLLRNVLDQARTVAPSDATVLILGETGTGKELIARAIHRLSTRKDGSFIKLNCAAIPTGLLESELFGHEKGAFTGAISQKIGRLELADKGTLFLDEVGEIPLELQPKLLRVLQDQEFERLGGTRTLRVNIRLVAATNRDLEKSIANKEFRSDLFYRLNVFPIRLPALRQRKQDIPALVRYFVQTYARRMNRQIETIPAEAMNALMAADWPGNIRELENIIERSVILSPGRTLNVPLTELQRPVSSTDVAHTLEALERQHIVRALRETRGVVAGLHGAAARLGLKRTTLQSRMQRMGISPDEYKN